MRREMGQLFARYNAEVLRESKDTILPVGHFNKAYSFVDREMCVYVENANFAFGEEVVEVFKTQKQRLLGVADSFERKIEYKFSVEEYEVFERRCADLLAVFRRNFYRQVVKVGEFELQTIAVWKSRVEADYYVSDEFKALEKKMKIELVFNYFEVSGELRVGGRCILSIAINSRIYFVGICVWRTLMRLMEVR